MDHLAAMLGRLPADYRWRIAERVGSPGHGPGELARFCHARDIDVVDLALVLAREHDAVGRAALAAVAGKPIRPWYIAEASGTAPLPCPTIMGMRKRHPVRTKSTDPRVVTFVLLPNPRRPGGKGHERYFAWRVGDTVDQCMARGLDRGDVNWDIKRGFVRVQFPKGGI